MRTRGQFTLFIIIGILVVGAIVSIAIFIENRDSNIIENPVDASLLSGPELMEYHLGTCVSEHLETGVQLLGLQGGNIGSIDLLTETSLGYAYIAVVDQHDRYLSNAHMVQEFEDYLELVTFSCLREADYPTLTYEVLDSVARVDIGDEVVRSDVDVRVNVRSDTGSRIFNFGYTNELFVDLGGMHLLGKEIATLHVRDPTLLDVTSLTLQEYNVTIVPESERLIAIITDERSKINGVPLSFIFGLEL